LVGFPFDEIQWLFRKSSIVSGRIEEIGASPSIFFNPIFAPEISIILFQTGN